MRLMEFHQIVVGQINNVLRIAARIIMIGRRREQMVRQRIIKLIDLTAHRALHLIKDNAVILWLTRFIQLNTDALLGKIQLMNIGEKTRIRVHRQQIKKIILVLGGERINRPIRCCHGIHERL